MIAMTQLTSAISEPTPDLGEMVVPEIGLRMDISNERAKRVLGWQPRSLPTMVKDMADSMIEFGVA